MKTNKARSVIIAATKEAGVEMSDEQTDKVAASFAKSMTVYEWTNRAVAVVVITVIVVGILYFIF